MSVEYRVDGGVGSRIVTLTSRSTASVFCRGLPLFVAATVSLGDGDLLPNDTAQTKEGSEIASASAVLQE